MGRYLAVRDYDVRVIPFPNNAADGCVITDPNGADFYTIVINANVSKERQLKALQHELEHIERADLHSDESVHNIEKRMAI